MRNLLKLFVVPAGLAFAGIPAQAAPATIGTAPARTLETTRDSGVTEARHTYRHWQRQERRAHRRAHRHYQRFHNPYRFHYAPPRHARHCYWSRYYHRRICR